MAYDQSAPKRPVALNLNADPVEQCRPGIGSVSAHAEALPAAGLAQRQAATGAEEVWTDRAIDAFAALYLEHGSLSEEMQSL